MKRTLYDGDVCQMDTFEHVLPLFKHCCLLLYELTPYWRSNA
jgi:hypothetical protein